MELNLTSFREVQSISNHDRSPSLNAMEAITYQREEITRRQLQFASVLVHTYLHLIDAFLPAHATDPPSITRSSSSHSIRSHFPFFLVKKPPFSLSPHKIKKIVSEAQKIIRVKRIELRSESSNEGTSFKTNGRSLVDAFQMNLEAGGLKPPNLERRFFFNTWSSSTSLSSSPLTLLYPTPSPIYLPNARLVTPAQNFTYSRLL